MSNILPRKIVEKVWGMQKVPEEFRVNGDLRIGEIWFEPDKMASQHLVKFLFTSEKLSVQVHPSNLDAQRLGLGNRGKDECWIVLDAQPDAKVALGLNDTYSVEAVEAAALDGSIEDMLVWHSADIGDFFHVPAGTIHAIGPGLTLLEVQQNVDITFRLFDYGRPRVLHLDHALQCAEMRPYHRVDRNIIRDTSTVLVDTDNLKVQIYKGAQAQRIDAHRIVVPLAGSVATAGQQFTIGQCILAQPTEVLESSHDAIFAVV